MACEEGEEERDGKSKARDGSLVMQVVQGRVRIWTETGLMKMVVRTVIEVAVHDQPRCFGARLPVASWATEKSERVPRIPASLKRPFQKKKVNTTL